MQEYLPLTRLNRFADSGQKALGLSLKVRQQSITRGSEQTRDISGDGLLYLKVIRASVVRTKQHGPDAEPSATAHFTNSSAWF